MNHPSLQAVIKSAGIDTSLFRFTKAGGVQTAYVNDVPETYVRLYPAKRGMYTVELWCTPQGCATWDLPVHATSVYQSGSNEAIFAWIRRFDESKRNYITSDVKCSRGNLDEVIREGIMVLSGSVHWMREDAESIEYLINNK